MFVRPLCLVALVATFAVPIQPSNTSARDKPKPPKNETVMSPGMRIQATTSVGEMLVTSVDELTRSYTWEGATRSVKMNPRPERWYGSLGLYYPGPGEHWKEHKGITRGVTEEGQQHFKTDDEALDWIRSRTYMPYVYRDDGLVVGWMKVLPRRQLNVEVWQILVNGKKPAQLTGNQNEKIVITQVELWASPLGQAVQKKNIEDVKKLLAAGADPNAKNINDRPVIVEAAQCGQHDIVQALLAKGAKPNARSSEDYTALLSAVEEGHTETIKALLAGGADVNAGYERGSLIGMTPLMMAAAARSADSKIVKMLLEKGADVNAKSKHGQTALWWAQQSKHSEIVRLLEEASAKK